jgi:hypothetical protein
MMGTVYATITIKNLSDFSRAEYGYVNEDEIRQTTVKAIVDSGVITLFITEELRQQLGLEIKGEQPVTIANGTYEIAKIAGPVEIQWENRSMICQPRVISDGNEILLGRIPLQEMDLTIDSVSEELVGAHGDEILISLPTVLEMKPH